MAVADDRATLMEAVALHQSGAFSRAVPLYRRYLRRYPQDVEGRYAYAVLHLQRGATDEAIEELGRVLAFAPGHGGAHYSLGRALMLKQRVQEAIDSYRTAIRCEPQQVDAYVSLGDALAAEGHHDDAERTLRQALQHDPDNLAALNNLGIMLADLDRAGEAVELFARAREIDPDGPMTAYNYANALKRLERRGDAIALYQSVVAARPEFGPAYNNLGNTLMELGRTADAFDAYNASMRIAHAPPADGRFQPAAAEEFRTTTAFKLRHDIEQFRHLAAKDIEPERFGALADIYQGVSQSIAAPEGPRPIVPLSKAQQRKLWQSYNRILHIADCPALAGPAINPDLNPIAIEAEYQATAPGITVVDDLLSPAALSALYSFCLDSTIWFNFRHSGGYLGAYMDQGFACPLLLQIADEMRARLPAIFRQHPLLKVWAYKYDSTMTTIPIHADFAAVNVNFWLTPTAANLDASGGGLKLYTAEAPLDWDFTRYNADEKGIYEFLARTEHREVYVPYRQNRAVLFNSNLFHASGAMTFKDGYDNRRINVTMLFGKREAAVG